MATQEKDPSKELVDEPTNNAEKPLLLAQKPSPMARVRFALSGLLPSGHHNKDNMDSGEQSDVRTDLATKRTLMAADRTLMAWVRTALSMITFGFTIYKFLEGLQQSGETLMPQRHEPRTIGLFLVGMGTLSMVLGAFDYWHTLKELRQTQYFSIWRPSFFISAILTSVGLAMFISIVINAL